MNCSRLAYQNYAGHSSFRFRYSALSTVELRLLSRLEYCDDRHRRTSLDIGTKWRTKPISAHVAPYPDDALKCGDIHPYRSPRTVEPSSKYFNLKGAGKWRTKPI
jgi:hypothetical protein